jgi:tetratricopeptide (TPR) repeat protein
MVDGWTGELACALQSALRMSNVTYAARLGIGVRTVADWHADPTMRPRPETQRILDTALKQASPEERARFAALTGQTATAQDAGADPRTPVVSVQLPAAAAGPATAATPAGGLHNLPAPRNRTFVDRTEDLAELATVMSGEPPGSPPVVHGLGGTGKSTLALHFAHAARARYSPVWWIPADSPVSVTQGFADLAARLSPGDDLAAKTSAEAAAWAVNWLQSHDGWLLVFDDAASPRHLESLLGTLTAGRHLITTRRATGWHRIARPLPLAVLPADAALELLSQVTGDGSDREALEAVAAELGYLPLALEQAAAYMKRAVITPAAYLDRLHRYPARMFAAAAADDEADRQRTIARIWQLSLESIEAEQPLAGEILRVLAWLSPDPIPRDLAYQLDDDPLAVDDALALLNAYSMITLTPDTITLHRLLQAVARTPDAADPHRTPEAVSRARDRAATLLLDSLPERPLVNVPGWPRWRALLPHAAAFTDHAGPEQDTPAIASILTAISAFMLGDGHQDQAITAAQRAVDASRKLHGPDARETLIARSFLASAYRDAGDLAAAGPLHAANLADSERTLGTDHPETLAARGNLAYFYALTHDEHRALALHERNLGDYERTLGPDHPDTVNARANLASAYRASGDLPRAIELHEQSVNDYARVYGPDHSETVTARSNLAFAYQLAGDLSRAVPLHRQVLADRERLYGPDHRYTELARQLLTAAEQQAADSPDNQ